MTDIVDETLRYWRQSTFVYGENDCLLALGFYVKAAGVSRTIDDVIADFIGQYDDEEGAARRVDEAGGPDVIIDRFDLPRIDPLALARGDIAVVVPVTGGKGVGVLCTGQGVASRAERGVIEISRRFVRVTHAWGVSSNV